MKSNLADLRPFSNVAFLMRRIQCKGTKTIHRIHKNSGRVEKLGLSTRARHFRTDRIFVYVQRRTRISFSQRETEDSIAANHAIHLPPTGAMLSNILICLDSMLPITHPRSLPHVHHFYEFGVLFELICNEFHKTKMQCLKRVLAFS